MGGCADEFAPFGLAHPTAEACRARWLLARRPAGPRWWRRCHCNRHADSRGPNSSSASHAVAAVVLAAAAAAAALSGAHRPHHCRGARCARCPAGYLLATPATLRQPATSCSSSSRSPAWPPLQAATPAAKHTRDSSASAATSGAAAGSGGASRGQASGAARGAAAAAAAGRHKASQRGAPRRFVSRSCRTARAPTSKQSAGGTQSGRGDESSPSAAALILRRPVGHPLPLAASCCHDHILDSSP